MLQNVYGEAAVLEPHVMPVEVLDMSDAAGVALTSSSHGFTAYLALPAGILHAVSLYASHMGDLDC